MGIFGGIGKVFGGALKIAGKVAGVASAIAPIPGLGFAGKVASGVGGMLAKAKNVEARVAQVMPGGVRVQDLPKVSISRTIEQLVATERAQRAGILLTPTQAKNGGALPGVAPAAPAVAMGAPPAKKRKKRRVSLTRSSRRRRRARSSSTRRKLTRAQLRAGFGGKRRMRR